MNTANILTYSHPVVLTKADLPRVNFSHISRFTDSTGIIQHALYDIPNLKEGYCIDDNARALMLMTWASKDPTNKIARRLLPVYLGFIHYMRTETNSFKNFMTYCKLCPEDEGSEDSFGRTIMALGYLVNESDSPLLVQPGKEILDCSLPRIPNLVSLRGMSNTIIGLCQYVKAGAGNDKKELVVLLADRIVKMYKESSDGHWNWFEPILAYDNAIMPLALLHAFEMTGDKTYRTVAFESLRFLESKVFHNNILRPIGNKGWLRKGSESPQFDQQGIDAMAMVLCYQQAWKLTHDKKYFERMCISYQWFHGANDLGMSLYDSETGGCADGLQQEGINYNKGAESTLAYWISHFAIADVLEK